MGDKEIKEIIASHNLSETATDLLGRILLKDTKNRSSVQLDKDKRAFLAIHSRSGMLLANIHIPFILQKNNLAVLSIHREAIFVK